MTSTTISTGIDKSTIFADADPNLQQASSSTMLYKLRATSNWVKKSYRKRNIWERLVSLDLADDKCYVVQPKNPNPPPRLNAWGERLWLAITIAPILVIQALWYHIVPEDSFFHTWHPIVAFLIYQLAIIGFILVHIKRITGFMSTYGTFDEHNRPRDYVPDKEVFRLVMSVLAYIILRVGGGLIIGGYDRHIPPSLGTSISWAFPIKIGLWFISLDFFFYLYHRAVHTFPALWKYHSKHHATKHPTPIQAILADDLQEIIEIVFIPLGASLVIPLTAHEMWIALCSLLYIEAMGHSGARFYWTHPFIGEILVPFQMEITVEDHDLHHRHGKSGKNYGKQSRIFDRLFGTIDERIEGLEK